MFCIIVNTVVMASRHFGQSDYFGTVVELINYGFAIIFTIEAIVKVRNGSSNGSSNGSLTALLTVLLTARMTGSHQHH